MTRNPSLGSVILSVISLLAQPQSAVGQVPATSPAAGAQTQTQQSSPSQGRPDSPIGSQPASISPGSTEQGGDRKSAQGSSALQNSASGKQTTLSAIAPSVPPGGPSGRPRIGLALGGGGALAMSEVGVLQWFEEHHIPVDVIAGTSMGCMVSSLYSSGKTIDQLKVVMDDSVFSSVFSFGADYKSRSFRRREDSRELPNGITIGLKHHVSFRNALLTDQGLNAFLDRQFFRYDDQTDFNDLPIPLRCLSTDLNEARTVTFARGSIPDAIRASVALPGIYPPFEMQGHEYVDGGVLENLPTQTVKDMNADVILAVSLPLSAVGKGDLGSIVGVLQRSFSVAIEGAERRQRKLADVVMMPDLKGFSGTDYLKTVGLSVRGYAAAEEHKAELLKYALNDEQWHQYISQRVTKRRGPAGPVLMVKVEAPNDSATRAVQRLFAPLVNQPVDTKKIEALLDQIRSDGRFEADYTVGYETSSEARTESRQLASFGGVAPNVVDDVRTGQNVNGKGQVVPQGIVPAATGHEAASPAQLADISARPILLVKVLDNKTGPPFALVGLNIEAQTTAVTRATLETRVIDQDLGGYGAELRSVVRLGYQTELGTEYYRPIQAISAPERVFFVAPHADLLRQPFSIYTNQIRLADRLLQRTSIGGDIGWSNESTQEFRAGIEYDYVGWNLQIGNDNQPSYTGGAQKARVRYVFDTQDRALVPQFGVHLVTEAGYLYNAVGSHNAPQLFAQASIAHALGKQKKEPKNIFVLAGEGGSLFHRDVAQPFRYTLGGPLRLSASAIDEYRGTDYFLVEPAALRRIAHLPAPLGQSIYVGAGYEYGQMFAPGTETIRRQDVFFGIVAETPLGVITLAPTFGSDDHRKFVFTLGKLF